jgi:hypothetical protein
VAFTSVSRWTLQIGHDRPFSNHLSLIHDRLPISFDHIWPIKLKLTSYLLTYLLTPWYRIFFEKLIVTQLVKQPAFFMEPEASLPSSQKSATRPYPEPTESNSPHWCLGLFQLLRSCQRIGPGARRFETFHNKSHFYSEGLLTPRSTPSWRTTPCRLLATAYSIYSQLPFVPRGLHSIRNLITRHAVVTRDPPNMVSVETVALNLV